MCALGAPGLQEESLQIKRERCRGKDVGEDGNRGTVLPSVVRTAWPRVARQFCSARRKF